MSKIHSVKILKNYADDIIFKKKNFEIRKDDRYYNVGDVMEFTVIDENGNVLGNHPLHGEKYEITYKHSGTGLYGIESGYCVLGVRETNESDHNTIYTHDEASRMLDKFEDVLSKYDICVPSPEDDEREPDNMIGLYGSTYSDLLDKVEYLLIDLLSRHKTGTKVEEYIFSGKY